MASTSPLSMIGVLYMTISNVFAVISEDYLHSTITECYNDIAQTMTDNDGNCQSEMQAISNLIDADFQYCAYFSFNTDQQCVGRDEYLSMMLDTSTNGYCGNYNAVTFYLEFQELNTNEQIQTLDASEYTKKKDDDCVDVLHEKVEIHYDNAGLVNYVHETKDQNKRICNKEYTNLNKINSGDLSTTNGFTIITAETNIDDLRAAMIMLDDEIRSLQSGWDINSKPNSPQLVIGEAYMSQTGDDITYGGKVGYSDDSSFIYIKFDSKSSV